MPENVIACDQATGRLEFFEIFIGTLVAPIQTFRRLALECQNDIAHLPGAFGIVVLVSSLDALRLTPANNLRFAYFSVPAEIIAVLCLWILFALVVGLTALCFGADISRVRAAFVTLGWSFLPWILLSPLSCFWKVLGAAQIIFALLAFAWIMFLQIVAIKQSCQMKVWQVLVFVLLVPPLLAWVHLLQIVQSLAFTLGPFVN